MLSLTRAGCWCAIGVMAMGSLHGLAVAAPMPPDSVTALAGPLTLDRALALTTRYGLNLKAAGLRSEAARARVADANRLQNPTLIATEENFGGDLGGSRREATLALGQVFELGGDRGARRATAEAEAGLASAEAGLVGREAQAMTAERFITAWSLQGRVGRLREGERLAGQAVVAARERHQAGASPELEVLRARSRATSQAVERQRNDSELDIARRELALSWGATEATFDSLAGPGPFPGDSANGARSPHLTHPELSRATAAEAVAAARIQSAEAGRTPDLTLSAGVRRLEEVSGAGFVVGVALPLPLWGQQSGGLAAAHMELAASTAERRATEQRLQLALVAATERMRVAAALLDTLRLRVQPAREELVGEMLRGYREGRTSYLDLVAEQGGLLETDLEIVEAEANLWRVRLRLDQLTGSGPLAPKGE